MVLADDLNGNGLMNILVTTMNGNLMNFETDTPFHPLRTWTSQTQGLNGFSFRENTTGVFFTESSRQFRDMYVYMFSPFLQKGRRNKQTRHIQNSERGWKESQKSSAASSGPERIVIIH